MRFFGKRLETKIGAGQALTLIISVILSFTLFDRDSQAYTGFCREGDVPYACCSQDADCGQGGLCESKKGICIGEVLDEYMYCDSILECRFMPGRPNGCIYIGVCMGGEDDGRGCYAARGICYGMMFGPPCNTDLDCGGVSPCFPVDPEWRGGCRGGTCVPCQGCSIATVTYGTELESKTDVLRAFRDKYLVNNPVGEAFVKAYYEYSPPIAHYIAERGWLKTAVRILLHPVIGFVSLFV